MMPAYTSMDIQLVNRRVEVHRSCLECYPALEREYKRKRRMDNIIELGMLFIVLLLVFATIVWLLKQAKMQEDTLKHYQHKPQLEAFNAT